MKLTVASRSERGFRRAGMFFGPKQQEVEVDEKTAAALKAEPQLVVLEDAASKPAPRDQARR